MNADPQPYRWTNPAAAAGGPGDWNPWDTGSIQYKTHNDHYSDRDRVRRYVPERGHDGSIINLPPARNSDAKRSERQKSNSSDKRSRSGSKDRREESKRKRSRSPERENLNIAGLERILAARGGKGGTTPSRDRPASSQYRWRAASAAAAAQPPSPAKRRPPPAAAAQPRKRRPPQLSIAEIKKLGMLLVIVNFFKLNYFFFFILCRGKLNLASVVGDPEPDLRVFWPPKSGFLVRGPDPAPDPSLFS